MRIPNQEYTTTQGCSNRNIQFPPTTRILNALVAFCSSYKQLDGSLGINLRTNTASQTHISYIMSRGHGFLYFDNINLLIHTYVHTCIILTQST